MDTIKKIGWTFLGAGVTYQLLSLLAESSQNHMVTEEKEVCETEFRRRRLKNIDFKSPSYQMIVKEQLVRNYQFFGEEGQEAIRKANVVIIGLEGIGTHLLNTLVRSGIETLTILDHGVVTKEDLATSGFFFESDIGKSRLKAVDHYLLDLCPYGKIELVDIGCELSKCSDERLV